MVVVMVFRSKDGLHARVEALQAVFGPFPGMAEARRAWEEQKMYDRESYEVLMMPVFEPWKK